jgi:hypothetical protein
MSRTCPDCTALQNGTRSLDEPHEYLVQTSRSKSSGARFYRCLLCNTFLTFAPEGDLPRWNPGFRPQGAPAPESRMSS